MFCTNCGNKNKDTNEFCSDCGAKIVNQKRKHTPVTILQYYGRDWGKKGILGTTAAPRFDLMADDKYFYLLKLPKFKGTIIGSIVGLLFLSFVGLIIGNIIGTNSDSKKRKYYRTAWIDFDDNIVSDIYKNHIFLQIPLGKIKTCLIQKNNALFFSYGDIKVVLKKNKNEYTKFDNFLNKYAL